jgi:hypothetical protein
MLSAVVVTTPSIKARFPFTMIEEVRVMPAALFILKLLTEEGNPFPVT